MMRYVKEEYKRAAINHELGIGNGIDGWMDRPNVETLVKPFQTSTTIKEKTLWI